MSITSYKALFREADVETFARFRRQERRNTFGAKVCAISSVE